MLTYLLLPARQSFASPRSDFGQRTSLAFDDLAAARAADAQRRALVSDPAAGSPRRRRRALEDHGVRRELLLLAHDL